MGIDFHNEHHRTSYTTRQADRSWKEALATHISFHHMERAVDIGCGGGIYAKALVDMGAASVIAVDFSQAMLEGAIENCRAYPQITFVQGNAFDTGLTGNTFDVVLERALIHHIQDVKVCFQEAYRLLRENGYFIVQDRTPEDCLLQGDAHHIRGYFFESFPSLIQKEVERRHSSQVVTESLKEVGFQEIIELKLWETRQVYANKEQLLVDLQGRVGRSLLHELNDDQLAALIEDIRKVITIEGSIIEKDRWTIWIAVKK
ncbi:class I SAM-dependent methyltransferase [Lysinibacillus cavernae]|uniref:class I SAM-dependent methyltransferase n=1 Tax=Lysinibacillus cavernae TaxID=2666135 RepID=UPI0012D977A8|nr:class I SAM-dependent methyltransferase [Lysinibacillus cavernae]